MKIRVGIPFAKHSRLTDTTLQSLDSITKCDDFEVEIVTQQGSNVPLARNNMVTDVPSDLRQQHIEGYDWLLCADADMGFTPDNLRRLLSHDLDIVSGAAEVKPSRKTLAGGWFPEVEGISPQEARVPLNATGLIEVDWAGAGFLLVRREVFCKLPYPWFKSVEVEYQSEEGPRAQVTSEDLGFCIHARRHGFKIMYDCDCRIEHVRHPNEIDPNATLTDALNDLLRNRETIIRHIKTLSGENRKLKEQLEIEKQMVNQSYS